MGLLSIFQSKGPAQSDRSASVSDVADGVQQSRVRARHRLIGAAVLLLMGVIVFPLLFETQPRPVAVDIPIEIPRRDNAPPLTLPAGRGAAPVEAPPEAAEDAGREVPAPRVAESASAPARPAVVADTARGEATPEKASRFIVQAGAYADNAAAKEVRAKVEKLGFKTIVQTADTPDGKRIRVRVGPFTSREEAEKVSARMKSGGVSAVVLTL
ncbi:MAG: SPOR domain-containing protein [Pseudomonadota bacterium]